MEHLNTMFKTPHCLWVKKIISENFVQIFLVKRHQNKLCHTKNRACVSPDYNMLLLFLENIKP